MESVSKTPLQSLVEAVIEGDPAKVKKYIHLNKNNVNVADEQGTPLIYHAVVRGKVEIVRLLLEQNVDVNVQQKYVLELPIYYAVKKGFVDIARELIKHGSLTNCVDSYGNTLLHYATNHGQNMVEVFLESGIRMDINDGRRTCPFRESIMKGSEKVVQVFLEYGVDVNLKDVLDKSTPLHCAVTTQNIRIVRMLLEYGADVHTVDVRNKTPLHLAASCEEPEIVNMLIQCGADINNKIGKETPLHSAVRYQRLTNARLLIDRGANLDVADSISGKTALHLAAERTDKKIVSLLLQHDADPTILTDDGKSALQLAIEGNNSEVVDLLLLQLFIRLSLEMPISDQDREFIFEKKKAFLKMCDEELTRMKEYSITSDEDLYVSYFTFLSSDFSKALKFCRRPSTVEKLKKQKVETLFPVYANMIMYRVAIGCDKYDLYYKSHQILQEVLDESCKLTTDITFRLVNYLNEHEMRFLVHSHYLEEQKKS